jgi:hypothetical protein
MALETPTLIALFSLKNVVGNLIANGLRTSKLLVQATLA